MEKQKIIIFDGHDNSGKSHIIKELSKRLNIASYKNKKESSRWQDKLISLLYGMDELVQFLEQTNSSVIFDRFHPAEYAYSKVFNRISHDEFLFDIDKRLAKLGCVIIYCYKDEEAYLPDDQDIVEVKDYTPLKQKYEEFLSKTNCKVIELNTSDFDLNRQITYILKELRGMIK